MPKFSESTLTETSQGVTDEVQGGFRSVSRGLSVISGVLMDFDSRVVSIQGAFQGFSGGFNRDFRSPGDVSRVSREFLEFSGDSRRILKGGAAPGVFRSSRKFQNDPRSAQGCCRDSQEVPGSSREFQSQFRKFPGISGAFWRFSGASREISRGLMCASVTRRAYSSSSSS